VDNEIIPPSRNNDDSMALYMLKETLKQLIRISDDVSKRNIVESKSNPIGDNFSTGNMVEVVSKDSGTGISAVYTCKPYLGTHEFTPVYCMIPHDFAPTDLAYMMEVCGNRFLLGWLKECESPNFDDESISNSSDEDYSDWSVWEPSVFENPGEILEFL